MNMSAHASLSQGGEVDSLRCARYTLIEVNEPEGNLMMRTVGFATVSLLLFVFMAAAANTLCRCKARKILPG